VSPELPSKIGRYLVRAELGWGAAGRVFLAHDPTVDRRVAVKLMAPRAALSSEEESELRERFLLEARAAGRLQHPNVVLVWDAGIDDHTGRPYLAMEYIDGIGFERVLARDKAIEPELVAAVGIQIARALDHAHREGIVHRDVKPANILLARDGTAKIGDFGIARVEGLALTRTGIVLGSPLYMSPEQVREEGLDGRSDLFSLAAVLFEAAAGAPPFPGGSLAAVTWRIAWGEPDPDAAERVNPTLRRILLQALSRSPDDRPASGAALASSLAMAFPIVREEGAGKELVQAAVERLAGPTSVVLETAATTRLAPVVDPAPSRRVPMLLGALVLLLLVSIAILATSSSSGRRTPTPQSPEVAAQSSPASTTNRPPPRTQTGSTPATSANATPRPKAELSPGAAEPRSGPASPSGRPPSPAPSFPPPPLDVTRPLAENQAVLEVVMRLRLREAHVTIWIDGERAWTEPLEGPRNVFSRMFGRDILAQIPLVAGEHTIEARVTGQSMKVDARTMLIANFSPGATRRLRLSLNPYTDDLDANWD
jgi:serine/threonine-protein kinase